VFETVKRSFVYQKVVDQVEEAILSGELRAGSRLPAERKFTGVFHTSRRTLREAMRVLEQKGLIEVRTGSKGGAFVTDRSSDTMRESFSILIRKKKIPYEKLFEFRTEIESEIAGLAARRATPSGIKALKALLADAVRLADNGLACGDEFNAQETKLHLFLGQMCGNPLYEVILGIIHEILVFPSFKVVQVDERYLREANRDWSALLGAIGKKQGVLARSLMRRHLKRFSRYHRMRGEVFNGRGWQVEAKAR